MTFSNPLQSRPPLSQNVQRQRVQLRPRPNFLNSNFMTKHAIRCVTVERPIVASQTMPRMICSTKAPLQGHVSLASIWREIQGSSNWHGLFEPLNHLLRDEIIRYGELVGACYKAFDLDPSSKRFLNCKHGKATMFQEVGIASPGYEITKYIYAAPGISMPPQQDAAGQSRWIGYVAVSTDDETLRIGRRDILVSFRGTVTSTEWLANLMSSLTPARFDPTNQQPDVKVESGFLSLYTSDDSTFRFGQGSCREQLLKEVTRLINQYNGEELSVTLAGHSMGSSLAILFGYDLTELGLNRVYLHREIPVTVYSFGGPRVGNSRFKERCEDLGLKVLRVVNTCDPITKLPGMIMNEGMHAIGMRYELPWSDSCYTHVGVELCFDFFKLENPRCVHDMDTYMGLLKCSMTENVKKSEKPGFLEKAKEMVARSNKRVHEWPWQDAARQVGDLVQSLGF
jgi:Lipase (class 3)